MLELEEKLHEECGVFGIWDSQRHDVAHQIYCGLLSLQHRGQEAAGIATCDSYGERGNLCLHKNMGLVTEVFHGDAFQHLHGNLGIGHVRYSTTGGSSLQNVQPFACYYQKGTLGLVYNGNLVNCQELKQELMAQGLSFQATTDTEVIQVLLAQKRSETASIEQAAGEVSKLLKGGFALLIMSPRKLVAVRDPWGLKPLCIGKKDGAYVFSSESCGLDAIGAEFLRDVRPGEIITVSKKGIVSDTSLCTTKTAHCIFEYIYFARLDSKLDGVSVYQARLRGGQALAKAYPVEADLVAGVPESGIAAARGYAEESGIPFAQVFYKNSYVGRTFIKPTQKEREAAVRIKLNVLPDVVKGKRIVLTDDSIVRGTTMQDLIRLLRRAGATEVHVRISSPPFLHPCYYGTDVPDTTQLIANRKTVEEIRQQIGADSLGYMRLEDLHCMTEGISICRACFDGHYPTECS